MRSTDHHNCNTPCRRCAEPGQALAAPRSQVDPGSSCGCPCHEAWRFINRKPLPDGSYLAPAAA